MFLLVKVTKEKSCSIPSHVHSNSLEGLLFFFGFFSSLSFFFFFKPVLYQSIITCEFNPFADNEYHTLCLFISACAA